MQLAAFGLSPPQCTVLECSKSSRIRVPNFASGAGCRVPSLCAGRCNTRQSLLKASKQVDDGHVSSLNDLANELLKKDPETAQKLQRLEAAAKQVATLQAMQAEVEAAMREAASADAQEAAEQERQQGQRASERVVDAEVEAATKLLQAAQLELEAAKADKSKWSQQVNEDVERQQSLKAGLIAAGGALASFIPFLALGGDPLLSSFLQAGSVGASGLLFGTTYRYAIRSDVNNVQLKGGVVAAFGLVRSLGAADIIQLSAGGTVDTVFTSDVILRGLLYAGESMLLFGFAAMAIEIAMQQGVIAAFGSAAVTDKDL